MKHPNPLITNTTRVHMSKNERFWTVNTQVIQKAPLWGFLPFKKAPKRGFSPIYSGCRYGLLGIYGIV